MRRGIEFPHEEAIVFKYDSSARILVSEGQVVTPDEQIAQTNQSLGYRVVPAARILKVGSSAVPLALGKPIGSRVYKGEVLAKVKKLFGLSSQFLLAPTDGIIERVQENGDIIIRYAAYTLRANAEVWGKVTHISQGNITILTHVARIHGVVAQGKKRGGFIEIMPNLDSFLLPSHITPAMAGHILIGGKISSEATIKKAIMMNVSGLVVGGVHARILSRNQAALGMEDIGITLLLTEGFGQLAIGKDVQAFLSRNKERYGIIDGQSATLTIPMQSHECYSLQPKTIAGLKVGAKVRVIAGANLGWQGTIRELPASPERLNSGLIASVACIDDGVTIRRIPKRNIELL